MTWYNSVAKGACPNFSNSRQLPNMIKMQLKIHMTICLSIRGFALGLINFLPNSIEEKLQTQPFSWHITKAAVTWNAMEC